MILVSEEIKELSLVEGADQASWRPSTYDATVGEIIEQGKRKNEDTFVLPPRGVVWVVSKEKFKIPHSATGLATLKTSWTHRGILALNVGIIDPGWHGPLSAALVNLSNVDFEIAKGIPFLRIAFMTHKNVTTDDNVKEIDEYLLSVRDYSSRMANTFLDISSIAKEVRIELNSSTLIANKIAKIAIGLGAISIIAAVLSTFAPISYAVYTDIGSTKVLIESLKKDSEAFSFEIKNLKDRVFRIDNREICIDGWQ